MKKLFNDLKCNICGSLFTSHRAWKEHKNSHINSFSCDKCKKTFNNKANLSRHYKSHFMPARPRRPRPLKYSCSLCQTGFENKIAFYHHMKTVHETKTQCCTVCGKSFFSKAEVTQHHKKAHTDYPRHLSCDKCAYPPITLIGAERNGYFITVLLK